MRQLEELGERLLREGIAYRHVRRFVGELRDHYEDTLRAETARGASPEDARRSALARLGSLDALAQGMIARSELQALSARYPKLWGCGVPFATWIGTVLLVAFAFVGSIHLLKSAGVVPIGGSQALAAYQQPADFFVFILMRILPSVVGALMLMQAARQRATLRWPIVGAAVLALIAGTTDTTINFSLTPEAPSELIVYSSLLPVFSAPFTDTLGLLRPESLGAGALWSLAIFCLSITSCVLSRRFARPVV